MRYLFWTILLISFIFSSMAEAQWLEYKGSALWNGAFEIAVQGNYAYTAGRNGMQIIDISEPNEPVLTSQIYLQGLSSGIDVSGDYAYVADRVRGLQIVDISDPHNPEIVGVYNNGKHIRDAGIYYPYCIFFDDSSTVSLDVGDPENPVEVFSLFGGLDYGMRNIRIRGDSCFALSFHGFRIYEITDYGACILKSSGGISWSNCRSFDVSGNYVYLADYESFYIFDASTSQAQLIAEIETGCQFYDTRIIGDYIYFISETRGLHVYDISDPANPVFLTALPIEGWWPRLASSGKLLYYLSQQNELTVIDTYDPVNPVIMGSLRGNNYIIKVTASGNLAFAVERNTGIHVVDINSPEDIFPVSFIPHPDSIQWFAASDDYLYVLNNYVGFSIYDISDPHMPFRTSYTEMFSGTRDMFLDTAYIFSCSYPGDLNIIDISDPYSPEEKLIYSTGKIIDWLTIEKNHAILMSRSGPREVIDISDISNPVRVFDSNVSENIRFFCADTARFIELLPSNYFLRYDVDMRTDPVSLIYRNDFELEINCSRCAINGYFAILNDIPSWYPEDYGIRLIDIGDPCCMWEIDFFKTPGYGRDVFIKGSHAFVADEFSLTVLDAHLPESEGLMEISPVVESLKLNNRPNPFNASTSIQFDLPETMEVQIDIYDILGRKIETLVSGEMQTGSHSVLWNAVDHTSGVYFYIIKTGHFTETRSCLLLK